MRSRWKGKCVDREILVNWITSFFLKKGFRKQNEISGKDNRRVLTYFLKGPGRPVIVNVAISGSQDDFEIEIAVDRKAEKMARLGILSTYFGGGLYMKGRLENSALVERLEGDFWDYIDEILKRNYHAKA